MITGDIRSKVDRIWDDFWSGGISNPLTVVEQITYLLFIKRLDEIHTSKELKANADKLPLQDPVFPSDSPHLRWSRFKDMEAGEMYENIVNQVFPFIKNLQSDANGAYFRYMKEGTDFLPVPFSVS
jgi:type I restriction enzyme M protein